METKNVDKNMFGIHSRYQSEQNRTGIPSFDAVYIDQ